MAGVCFLQTFTDVDETCTLEALHAIVTDDDAPQIIRDHVVDALQFALRNHPDYFTRKEIQWLAQWDDTRIPIAAGKILNGMNAA